jgi:hypothetical protein
MSKVNAHDGEKNTPIKDLKQPPLASNPNVVNLKDKGIIDYDIKEVCHFLDVVFHDLMEDEEILTWYQKANTPAFPKKLSKTINVLQKTNLPRTFYFGTSTVTEDADGKLYNRKANFDRLHVIVLDDLGTKVPIENLPEDLTPNYIIETSEGNYQYGYILAEPIDSLELAEALIHLVYTSGYSDGGGKMPTKVVRLPTGINGKKGEKGEFRVKLIELNNDYWTPTELLEVMDVGVSWDDVLKDVSVSKRGKSALMTGTSSWSPIKATAGSLNGVVDPLLEWLYDEDLVTNDNGHFVTIRCPWADEHSDGEDTAGYSPVGRGGEYSNMRSFNCFHDHCKDRKADDFLQWAATVGAPRVPRVDNVADLVADYAYVASEDSAYRMRGVNKPVGIKIGAFKNLHPRKVGVHDLDGKIKLVNEHALWLMAPNRLSVQGTMLFPANPESIIEHDGLKYLNTYAAPTWGKGSFNQGDVDRFNEFIAYLVPDEKERGYWLEWLAAKAQNPTFKGAAVLMVAPTQGTGRTTLTDMIATLFSQENVKKVTFPQLCGASDAGSYNDWQEALIVTCDEIMSDTSNKHKVYETMKDLFDPRPKTVLINTKYGSQRHNTVYTSYMLLTNHTDAVGHLGGDRRVYVVQNTRVAETPEYFVKLNAWLDVKNNKGAPAWAESVWRWLQTLEPDLTLLNSPAPTTKAKQTMIDETTSVYDILADTMIDLFDGVIPTSFIEDIALSVLEMRGDKDADIRCKVVTRIVKNATVPLDTQKKINGKNTRLRVATKILAKLDKSCEGTDEQKLTNYAVTFVEALKGKLVNIHSLVIEINRLVDEKL